MQGFFGRGLAVHTTELIADELAVNAVDVAIAPSLSKPPAVSARVRRLAPAAPMAASRRLDLGAAKAASRSLKGALALPRASRRSEAVWQLAARSRRLEGPPAPALRAGLAAARRLPAKKCAVPARFLAAEALAGWQVRLAAAKRLPESVVQVVGIFPHVPIQGDRGVRYLPEEGAIAYPPPDGEVPLSTIVVGKHRGTGKVLLARFLDDPQALPD